MKSGISKAMWLGVLLVPAAAMAGDDKAKLMDTNNDGVISSAEHAAGAKTMFTQMDANNDGKVTAAEMDAAHQKLLGKKHVKSAKSEMSAAEKIKIIDTNGDGVLTQDELSMAAMAMFEKMDTDQDSFLTKSEIKAGHEKYMRKPSK